ncbi:MAG: InlB B-repeat-containing protein, partial [Clostridiales bacterium]|nr:InlB B-repeat-containing protein [Clostridiales bacterium]
ADTVYGVSVASGYAVGKNADADTKGTYPYTVAAKGTQYTVTFEVTDGSVVGDSSITVEFDSAYGTLPTATLNNSAFVCWCTEDGTEITSTSTVVIAGDHTLYASGQCNHTAFDSEGFCLCGEYYQPADWNSTEGYYEIGNVGQFLWFESLVNGDSSHSEFTSDDTSRGASANAVLTADIDMSSYSSLFTPMGRVGSLYNETSDTSSITSYGYTGTFDGQGHTISNLTISTVTANDIGIFATLGGTVKNLGIISFKYTQSSGDVRGGAIAGQILPGGTVENCYVQSSTVTCTGGVGGVLAGANFGGTIKNCYVVSSSVTASRKGYLVGDNSNDNGASVFKGTITNCYTDSSSNVGKTGGVSEDVTQKSSTVFASGVVAYLLQNGQSDTSSLAWGQNLGTDSYPVLTLTEETLRVLKVVFDLDGATLSTVYLNNGLVCDSYPEPSDHYVYTFYSDSAYDIEITDTGSYTFDYTASNSITVYVKQGGATYNVTFVIENASVNNAISTYEYGVGADLPTADDITCDQGYAFVGWYTSADYSSSAVTSISASEYGDKTYYARIISSTQTVTFDANGGTVSPSTATVTYGEEYGTLPTPTRTDYAFGGWFTEADGGDLVTSDTVVTTTGNHTLYAHWFVPHFAVTTSDGSYTYTADDYVLYITSGGEYTITMNTAQSVTSTTRDRIKVTSDEDVTITIVDLNVTNSSASPFEIDCNGDVTVKLSGDNVLTATGSDYAGLQKSSTQKNKLYITSADGDGETTGTLTATGGGGGAGIGSTQSKGSVRYIYINGGTITAKGGSTGGAGIGGGYYKAGEYIYINGGNITATGGSGGGAGIGGGSSSTGGGRRI